MSRPGRFQWHGLRQEHRVPAPQRRGRELQLLRRGGLFQKVLPALFYGSPRGSKRAKRIEPFETLISSGGSLHVLAEALEKLLAGTAEFGIRHFAAGDQTREMRKGDGISREGHKRQQQLPCIEISGHD